ncbi:hypothetical protein L226DRAFT_342191 [Lentinus tigrinus ALCF2SS1-7]|uniref:SWIM-type domain-containing protein n=1 Tax=Lentinus tigrinus ALCF2SS1-6 TaxID=1328759 RepID=A0A5C2RP06_9APHY|nr:hypothetical protein L227DRAFT_402563 [Lentinus tigrinus ALCF2SS1-6]RPD68464.1 hypothetical protein L226DRAFT_342191 [Lentinus tigrinus ALCF2SS1-7]
MRASAAPPIPAGASSNLLLEPSVMTTHPSVPIPPPFSMPPLAAAGLQLPILGPWNNGLRPPGAEGVNVLPSPNLAPSADPVADGYWDALSQIGGLFRLDDAQFVFQGWDEKAESLQIGVYHHLTLLPPGPETVGTSCTCPGWKARATCLHVRVLVAHLVDLLVLVRVAPTPVPPAVFLHSTPFRDIHVFSCVASTGKYESGKRVIVTYQREGRWHCQSCRYTDSCKHKPHAIDFARIAGLVDRSDDTGTVQDKEDDAEASLLLAAGGHNDHRHGSISSLHIPPPRWCALPHEATAMIPNPEVFGLHMSGSFLDSVSRCACGRSIATLSALERQTARSVPAILYGLARRQEVLIEVIPCPSCRHVRRSIGPDLGACGVFNWNNAYLFTHELLDSYTGSFTASETPFSAFCLATRRRYENYSEDMKFCSEETFVRAWFAFIQLQELGGTMLCPTCGTRPPVIIADGASANRGFVMYA